MGNGYAINVAWVVLWRKRNASHGKLWKVKSLHFTEVEAEFACRQLQSKVENQGGWITEFRVAPFTEHQGPVCQAHV